MSLEPVDRAVLASPERLAEVQRIKDAFAQRERRLDYICAQASALLDAPVVHLSIVDEHEQTYIAAHGLPEDIDTVRRVGLDYSICQYVVSKGTTLLIEDAGREEFLADNRLVQEWGVQAYLGEPVRAPSGEILGAFCALSYTPRHWDTSDVLIMRRMTQLGTAALLAETKAAGPAIENRRASISEAQGRVIQGS